MTAPKGRFGPPTTFIMEGEIFSDQMKHPAGAITPRAVREQLDEIEAEGGAREITLLINSDGGNLAAARQIHAMLRKTNAQMAARVTGQCCSSATVLLLAADYREAAPDALFLLHYAAMTGGRGSAAEHQATAAQIAAADRDLAQFYANRCGRSRAMFEETMAAEKVLSAQKACEMSLIHNVLDGRSLAGGAL